MEILDFTVRSCLHMVRYDPLSWSHEALGSGVMIQYKNRFFVCTVSHFTDYPDKSIGILTGRTKGPTAELYELGDFSYMDRIEFEEHPDAEDLELILQNPSRSATRLDIAFKEIPLIDNLLQPERVHKLSDEYTLTVNSGAKWFPIVDDDYEIDTSEYCSFYGRIRPNPNNGILEYQEQLYWGLPIVSLSDDFIKMDLGAPIRDYARFKGCSGAPIIDMRGRLVGVLTHGDKDLNSPYIYGFRFDRVKQWIDLMYFQEPLSQM
jgi:hypothetical protein